MLELPLFGLATVLLTLPWLVFESNGATVITVSWLTSIGSGCVLLLIYSFKKIDSQTPRSKQRGTFSIHKNVMPSSFAWSLAIAAVLSAQFAWVQLITSGLGWWPWIAESNGQIYDNLRQRNLFASLTGLGLVATFFFVQRTPHSAKIDNKINLN